MDADKITLASYIAYLQGVYKQWQYKYYATKAYRKKQKKEGKQ